LKQQIKHLRSSSEEPLGDLILLVLYNIARRETVVDFGENSGHIISWGVFRVIVVCVHTVLL
jgi:hypothetical protein